MKVLHKRTPYRVCPRCGAHLDAGEACDCGWELRRKTEPPERADEERGYNVVFRGYRA